MVWVRCRMIFLLLI